jgi:hypothetical protein
MAVRSSANPILISATADLRQKRSSSTILIPSNCGGRGRRDVVSLGLGGITILTAPPARFTVEG